MPKYNYKCSDCNEGFEIYHSMSEIIDACILCESPSVQRIPSLSFTTTTSSSSGKLVTSYIEETKKAVAEQKQKLKEDYNG